MKKILDNKDLFEQFKNDREVMSQKQLAEKYSISLSTVQRLVKKLKSPEDSPKQSQNNTERQSQNNSEQQSQNNSEEQTQNNSEEQSQNNSEEQTNSQNLEVTNVQTDGQSQISIQKSLEQEILSQKSIEQNQQEEQIIDKSLINYLNKHNDSIEIQRNKKEKIQKIIPEKPQIIQQPLPVIVQQIDLQQNGEDENEIQNFMIKICKMIQFFKNESCIHSIIGSTDFQQQQFISRLYLKNLEEIKLIHKTIQFELLFSRLNSFMQDTIESSALFIERLLLSLDINVVGCFQELQQDEEFQFYYQLMLCDNAFIASAKQIIFMKFIKNYYKKYSENKKPNIMFSSTAHLENEWNFIKNIYSDSDLDEKLQRLFDYQEKNIKKKKLYYQYQMISKLLTQVFSLGRHLFLTIIVSVQYPKYILNGLIRNNIDFFFSELNQLALKGVDEMTFTNINYKEFDKFVNENNHDYQYIFYNNRERSKENRLMIVKAQLINLEQKGKKKQKIKL